MGIRASLAAMMVPRDLDELHELASRPTAFARDALERHSGDVLVLGAAGKMGLHLCLMLRRALDELGSNAKVRAVSRWSDAAVRADFESRGIATLPCDLTDAVALDRLPDVPNVFFLAGVKFGATSTPDLLHRMNVEMPRLVARRYRDARIVALSTGCVYSFVAPESGGSREGDATAPPGAYAESCLGRERAFTESGALCSLIRLNYAVDLRYGVLVDIALKVRAGLPVDLSTGHANVIWQGDAIAYVIGALGLASSPPFLLNVTGEDIIEVREVAKRFGGDPLFTGEPKPGAWLNNAGQCHRLFGKPRVGTGELVEMVRAWLDAGGETLGKATQFENREGRY